LSHDICPFDFSKLAVLSIAGHTCIRKTASIASHSNTQQRYGLL
jgi:hypothetical protein